MRPKCLADKTKLAKIMRANLEGLTPVSLQGDPSTVLELHYDLIREMLNASTTLPRTILAQAAKEAFPKTAAGDLLTFTSIIIFLIQWLRRKRKHSTTGIRQPAHVKRLVAALAPSGSLGQQLRAKARSLTRQASEDTALPSPLKRRRSSLRVRHASDAPSPESKAAESIDLDNIAALYGVKPRQLHGKSALDVMEDPCVCISSEEEAKQQGLEQEVEEKGLEQETGPGKQFWDNSKAAMARCWKDGRVVHAKMEAGPDGFQIAVWPSGSRETTEKANLCMPARLCHHRRHSEAANKTQRSEENNSRQEPGGGRDERGRVPRRGRGL